MSEILYGSEEISEGQNTAWDDLAEMKQEGEIQEIGEKEETKLVLYRWDDVDAAAEEVKDEYSENGTPYGEISFEEAKRYIEEEMRETMTVKGWYEKWEGWDEAARNADGTLNREMYNRDHETRLADWNASLKNTYEIANKSGKRGAEWRQVLRENGINIDEETAEKWLDEAKNKEMKEETELERLRKEVDAAIKSGKGVEADLMERWANSGLSDAGKARNIMESVDSLDD